MENDKYDLCEYTFVERAKEFRINKSNELILKQRFNLTLQEQKILAFLISQVEPKDEDFKTITVKIHDFCEICGLKGNQYVYIKDVIKKLAGNTFWLNDSDQKKLTLYGWIEKNPVINYGDGTVSIKLNQDLKPYLIQLKEQYTSYGLYYVLNFECKYTMPIYELLRSCAKLHRCIMDIEVFRSYVGVNNKYKEFRELNRRIISPSVDEINKNSDIRVSVKPEKIGKRIVRLIFKIRFATAEELILSYAKIDKQKDVNELEESAEQNKGTQE